MEIHIIIFLAIGGLSLLGLLIIFIAKIVERRIRRRSMDKPIVENHKLSDKPPTWRFQKYHPSKCPHYNGIYRELLVDSIKKTIFVCADCVDVIESEEIK